MSKILIVYKSRYGSTKKYVDMLKKKISCDVFEIGRDKVNAVDEYDFILAAGGIYAGGIAGMKFIQKNLQLLSDKKVAVFAVGASPFEEESFEAVKRHNLKNIPFEIPVFYGRGAYDEAKMSWKDRALCRLLRKSLKKNFYLFRLLFIRFRISLKSLLQPWVPERLKPPIYPWLGIGDFSKLSRISIRMLRHYDEIGLLRPEAVDAFTGYRYYREVCYSVRKKQE